MENGTDASLIGFLRRYRFMVLMISLGAIMLVSPFVKSLDVRGSAGLAELAVGLLFIFMTLSAAETASRGRLSRIIAWCLVVPVTLIWIAELVTGAGATGVALARHAIGVLFIGFVILLILGHLFSSARVTADTIAASLCIYFLLAVLWAEIYSIIGIADPGSFEIGGADAGATLELGGAGTATSLYYSLVTLTTLGYGDVVPRSAPARMFAAMEAATGQIYLAVLVARLVGMHIAHATWDREADNRGGGP